LRAQQKAMPVIGYLNGTSPEANAPQLAAFRQGLSDTGWAEGQNLVIEYRWAEFHYDRLPALAADLVGRKVDLIAACGGAGEALAAQSATSTVPIVFATGADPVGTGLVASLGRPGGNLTGGAILTVELTQKRVELISELVPQAKVIGYLMNPKNSAIERNIASAREATGVKGLGVAILKAGTESEIDDVFTSLGQVDALVVGGDMLFISRREQIVSLAARHQLPAIYVWREYVVAGGLIAYGAIFTAAQHVAGTYAGKILHGAKPADLPVQQSTNFELVVNLNTARALDLTIADFQTCWRSRNRGDGPLWRGQSAPRCGLGRRHPSCRENRRRSRAHGAGYRSPYLRRARRKIESSSHSRGLPLRPRARRDCAAAFRCLLAFR
jgi:putative ABC transport system substrate-binding protein